MFAWYLAAALACQSPRIQRRLFDELNCRLASQNAERERSASRLAVTESKISSRHSIELLDLVNALDYCGPAASLRGAATLFQ